MVLGREDYVKPPAHIESVLTSDAMHNRVTLSNLSPDGEHFLVSRSGGMPALAVFARPYVNLGETAIDHSAKRSRRLTTGNTVGYDLVSHRTGKAVSVETPEGLTVSGATWSPDGRRLAFLAHGDDASHIYVAAVGTGKSRRVTDRAVLATLVTSLRWAADGKQLLVVLVPENAGPMPVPEVVAEQPQIWMSRDGKTPSRTYRFLLKTPHDQRLLEYLSTGQLATVDVKGGRVTSVGKPAMFTSVDVSPDGKTFRVTTMRKPFSYLVPRRSFGSVEELWDRKGKVLNEISKRELREGPPARGAGARGASGEGDGRVNRRSLAWRLDGKGLSFLQREPAPDKGKDKGKDKDDAAKGKGSGKGDADAGATDKKPVDKKVGKKSAGKKPGKPGKKPAGKQPDADASDAGKSEAQEGDEKKGKPKRKDRVMQWLPPYGDDDTKVIWESDDAIQSVQYSQDCGTLYIRQTIDGKRKLFAVKLTAPDKQLDIVESKAPAGSEGQGSGRRVRRGRGGAPGPGRLMNKPGARGGLTPRLSGDGKSVYLQGSEPQKKGETGPTRAFIDRVTVGSGEKKRIWTSAADVRERLLVPLDDDISALMVARESRTTVPDSWIWTAESGELRQMTHNADPAPEVTAARRERFQVTRVDGFKFWVRVTIPRDYGQRLPALFWFYPREFTSQKAYDEGQRNYDDNRFPGMRTRSMELLTMCGYVVVQPDCPIVGEAGRMNDNFVGDLRNSLWAVIDELDKRQIIDRDRLAIGGHSYGAFGTANALVHTPFFKAGIAGDGNYNRTLTPMSFQSERRNLWDARETYFRMSPLLWANQLNGALLMYHGADDANTGTFPINSPRMFQVLNGLGKKTALYVYPYEGHGPGAKETVLDLWARWVHWLGVHVKNPGSDADQGKPIDPADISEVRRK